MNRYKNQALPILVNLPFFMLETVFLIRSSENFLSLSGSKPEQYILIAVTRAKAYADMSKSEMNSAYDTMRKDDPAKAAIEGMKMHRAFFGK